VRDVDAELNKLGFIRILVGVVALARVVPIVYGSYFYFYDRALGVAPSATLIGIGIVALLLLLTVGFLTPVALVALLQGYGAFDAANSTRTLGTQIFVLLLVLLLLTAAGSRRSIDGILMRNRGAMGRMIERLYALPGRFTESALSVVYLLLFMAFAVISFGAMLVHAQDHYWMQGYTLQVLFASSYLSRVYPIIRELEAAAPDVLRALSVVGGIGQAAFQLFMLPLIFTRLGGWFVVIWGLSFFLASVLFLELSYLPYMELWLWAALFVRVPSRKPVEVFYDDFCNLCKGTVKTLRMIDAFGSFKFRPASTNAEAAAVHGIDVNQLSASLHGLYEGRVYVGYDLYLLMTTRAPLLWIFAPILWLGRLLRFGPRLYEVVARNRRRMFGTCEVAYDANRRQPTALKTSAVVRPVMSVICAVFLVLFASTLFLRVPDLASRPLEEPRGIHRLAFDVPNVFNAADLQMSDIWPVIYRDNDGTWELVPLHALDGQKLLYPRGVDILYFGNSLRWRRLALNQDGVKFSQPGGKGYELVQRAIAFDDRLRGRKGGRYKVEIYRTSGTDPTRMDRAKYAPELVYTYEVYRAVPARQ
jgi:predicted DCC family thiol-disulfide oxidoreductase YuxK